MTDTRLDPLRPILAASGCEALALVPGPNFRSLFGADFHSHERPLVVVLTADGRSAAIVPNLELGSFRPLGFAGKVFDYRDESGYGDAFGALGRHIGRLASIAVEGQTMRVFTDIALRQAFPDVAIRDCHAAISAIRLRKGAAQLDGMRAAIALSEAALEATLAQVRVGMTEKDVEQTLVRELFAAGSDGLAFGPIVAAGANSARPHAHARADYAIAEGDALLFDFGGTKDGWLADITRTVFVRSVSDTDRAFYDTVLAANEAGRAAIRPGATAHDVDDAVQRVLESSAFARFRRHKTGHGLGLEVHEEPYIMRGNLRALEPGMTFTVEPGLYEEGRIGVRIEDDVAVTEDGHACLTSFPRDLRLVG